MATVKEGSPLAAETIHYEAELVLLIGQHVARGALGRDDALGCLRGVGLGLDLTRRDKQNELKNAGLPWAAAKAFQGSAVLTPFVPADKLAAADLNDISFELAINDQVRWH
jgi:2-keto-4-pentenoate hydratase/2-oxohepta-3-ene-1,7-dioic acid hydratase in catechol pathway